MLLPRPITPSLLRAELGRLGCLVTERTLRSWRTKGLLPPLKPRGRGRGRGKENYWQSPKIIEQAAVVDELMKRNIPNDEARLIIWLLGFSVKADRVREAWLSCLGKLKIKLELKRTGIVKRRGSEFAAIEDELSALTAKFVPKLAAQFGLDRHQSAEILISLFGLTFERGYFPDTDFRFELTDLIAHANIIAADQLELKSADHFTVITKFIRDHISFKPVHSTVASASDSDFNHTHRRWRGLLKSVPRAIPELADDEASKFVAVGFGRLIAPVIMQFIRGGRTPQIDQSIAEITELIARSELAGIIGEMIRGNDIGPLDKMPFGQLFATLRTLGNIWDYHGFPFGMRPSK
jgi:hypothetical protein